MLNSEDGPEESVQKTLDFLHINGLEVQSQPPPRLKLPSHVITHLIFSVKIKDTFHQDEYFIV